MKYTKLEQISIKNHPELNEAWVQDVIAEDPEVLGIGDVILRDKERKQPRAGRLDLLLQDMDAEKRYEVEVQLGEVDESHIIRTIEYWDIERKRYPQYNHCGVIIAENITSRFLNVIGLFNGMIPLIAIQMTAIQTESGVGLSFTKVLDEMTFGLPDEDEDINEPTDRKYWENRSTKNILSLADKVHDLIKKDDPSIELKYNKQYIGTTLSGVANTFVTLHPRKKYLKMSIKLPKTEEVTSKLEESGLAYDYVRWGAYRLLRITHDEFKEHTDLIGELLTMAYNNSQ